MPKQRQTIDIPFAGGVDQKSDPRYVAIGSGAQIINGRKQKLNVIQKRPGHNALTKTIVGGVSSLTAAVRGLSYRGAPMLSDGQYLYGYSDAAGLWTQFDRVSQAVALDRVPLGNWGAYLQEQDLLVGEGYVVVVLCGDPERKGTSGLLTIILDAATFAPVVPLTVVDYSQNIQGCKLVLCGTVAVLTYVDASSNLQMRTLDLSTSTLSWGSSSTRIVNATQTGGSFSGGAYDVGSIDANRIAVTYQTAASGTHHNPNGGTITNNAIAVEVYNLSGTFLTGAYADTIGSNPALAPQAFAMLATAGGYLYSSYGWVPNGTTKTTIHTWGLLDNGGTTATNVLTLTSGSLTGLDFGASVTVDATDFVVFWDNGSQMGASPRATFYAQQVSNSSGTLSNAGPLRTMVGLSPLSRPVYDATAGACFGLMYTPSLIQGTAYLVAFDFFGSVGASPTYPARVIATVNARQMQVAGVLSGSIATAYGLPHLCASPSTAGGLVYVGLTVVVPSSNRTSLVVQPFDLASPLRFDALMLGNMLGIASGLPTTFDGQSQSELGWVSYPEGMTPTAQTSGGSMADGSYSYVFTYEWTDANGNIQRSATSAAQIVTVTGGSGSGSVSWVLPAVGTTRRSGPPVQIVPYRTAAGGQIYYRVPTDPVPSTLESPTGSTVTTTWVDTSADASIATHATLYTTGGTLDDENPPSARILIAHKTRWWLAGCDDPTIIWASKQIVTGETPGFNEALQVQATGAVRALASLDDKLIMFVQRGASYGIEFITGEGPDDTGANSDWSFPPQPIPSDVGALDQRSVVVGPFGVLFRSNVGGPKGVGGFFLLTRDLQVQYVGASVEDSLAAYPVVTSAVLHPSAGRVYVTCTTSDTSITTGVRLVYDHVMGGLWYTDQLIDPDTSSNLAGVRTCIVANAEGLGPTYHWVSPTGRVYRENVTGGFQSFQDAGNFVQTVVRTGWIKPSLQGFARFWRVLVKGDQLDACDLAVTLTFDDASSAYYSEVLSFTNSQLVAFDRYPEIQMQMTPLNQKAQSMQITVSDATPSGFAPLSTGAGTQWVALSVDLGVDEGVYRNIPAGQRG